MTIYERIKARRKELGLTADIVAEALGVSRATVYRYESSDIEKLPTTILESLSKVLRCSPGYLMGWEDNDFTYLNDASTKNHGVSINVLGRVAAGIPMEAIENIIDTEEISEKLAKTGEFFGLQIHGDSMEPRMYEGDVVIVRKQDDADTGDVVIALINGNDATCKRLSKYADGICLLSLNSKYEPMFFSNQDIINKPVKIIGKVVELRGKLL